MHDRRSGTLAAAAAAALFGSSYVATAFQLHGFAPLAAAFWRTALATVVLVVVVAAQRLLDRDAATGTRTTATTTNAATDASRSRGDAAIAPRSTTPAAVTGYDRGLRILAIGLLGGLVFLVGMNLAVSAVGATVTSFVAGLYAITSALFAVPILGEALALRTVVGFVAALLGTVLLAELAPSGGTLAGLAWGGIAATSFGLYLVLVRRWSRAIRVGPIGIALTTSSVSAVGLGAWLAATAPAAFAPRSTAPEVLLGTAWLVLVMLAGPILTTIALRRVEAAVVSSMLLINPITATVLAAVLLGERPSAAQLLGGLLVLGGMGLATDLVGAVRRRRAAFAA